MKRYYLITTEHLEDRLWFRDGEDFRVAMNYVAVAAFLTGVMVLAFILMSNHVHFVLACSREDAERFVNTFKRLYASYYYRKYGVNEFLRRNGVDIRDQNILSASEDLCHSLFRVNRISDLGVEQKTELLRQLGRRFSADLNQICRVTGIPYEEAARMLDGW